MARSRTSESKPSLSITITRKLKVEIGDRKVSGFVERAIAKEL